jgi:NAD(P)H-flavin reductase
VLVGSGAGLAPLVSMVRHLDAVGTEREVVLCHGARYAEELGYAELFRELVRRSDAGDPGASGIPRFRYLATVSRPDAPLNAGWTGPTGRVETLLPDAVERATGAPLEPESSFVHVCGYRGTIEATLAALAPRGFRTQRAARADGTFDVLSESYGP